MDWFGLIEQIEQLYLARGSGISEVARSLATESMELIDLIMKKFR